MTLLVLAFHHGPEALRALRSAVSSAGLDAHVLGLVSKHGALSSAYHAEAAVHRVTGRILPSLTRSMGMDVASKIEDYDGVLLVSWSAGYALVQDLLASAQDVPHVRGWVALDSGYGPVTPGEIRLAKQARGGERVYLASYTDVPTSGYASTGQHLDVIQREAGDPRGLFDVEHLSHDPQALARSLDKGAFWRGEHIGALRRGPERVVAAIRALGSSGQTTVVQVQDQPPVSLKRGDRGDRVVALQVAINASRTSDPIDEDGIFGPKTEAAVKDAQRALSLDPTGLVDDALLDRLARLWSNAVLAVAQEDLAAGIHEDSPNDGADLRRLYFDPIGLTPPANWCAAGVTSWIRRASERLGRPMPIAGSAVAKELMTQFQTAQRDGKAIWIHKYAFRESDIVPGVIPVWDRSQTGKPETAWWGHVGVCRKRCVAKTFGTIEANSGTYGDRVAAMPRKMSDVKLLGIGILLG